MGGVPRRPSSGHVRPLLLLLLGHRCVRRRLGRPEERVSARVHDALQVVAGLDRLHPGAELANKSGMLLDPLLLRLARHERPAIAHEVLGIGVLVRRLVKRGHRLGVWLQAQPRGDVLERFPGCLHHGLQRERAVGLARSTCSTSAHLKVLVQVLGKTLLCQDPVLDQVHHREIAHGGTASAQGGHRDSNGMPSHEDEARGTCAVLQAKAPQAVQERGDHDVRGRLLQQHRPCQVPEDCPLVEQRGLRRVLDQRGRLVQVVVRIQGEAPHTLA
mmetsp:Transcript_60981/g.157258  ORF Transcript_60981/g.157258 Transcript_60981/m.157258 type:complete len:273 (-) Transcript_60981:606-1424(-)